MKRYFGFSIGVLVLTLVSTSFAEFKEQKCWVGDLATVEHRNGVTVRTVSFIEQSKDEPAQGAAPSAVHQKVTAHVYVPDGDAPLPLILFSHSAIHSLNGVTDLQPFAMAMARAGAASMVLDRTMKWEPYDEQANRDHSVMECASRWMMSQIRVDGTRIGTSGSNFVPQAIYDIPIPHGPVVIHSGYGTTGPAEWLNTESMMSMKGQMWMATKWWCRHFHLREVKAEWLKVETKPDGPQMAAN